MKFMFAASLIGMRWLITLLPMSIYSAFRKHGFFKKVIIGIAFLMCSTASVYGQGEVPKASEPSVEAVQPVDSFKAIPALPALKIQKNQDGSEEYTVTLQILLMMTALSFLPALLMMMTSFTRIIIVLSILRQALGLQQAPSNQIIIGLSLFLTFFIMSPVWDEVSKLAINPYIDEQIGSKQALENAKKPFHEFMIAQTRESDLDLFFHISATENVATPEDVPFSILMPAFITSELKTAFQIGFIIFIPFLVIDIVVASVLMAMGMMMLSPLIISLPFKIMLFVMVDGWALIIGTLAASFGV